MPRPARRPLPPVAVPAATAATTGLDPRRTFALHARSGELSGSLYPCTNCPRRTQHPTLAVPECRSQIVSARTKEAPTSAGPRFGRLPPSGSRRSGPPKRVFWQVDAPVVAGPRSRSGAGVDRVAGLARPDPSAPAYPGRRGGGSGERGRSPESRRDGVGQSPTSQAALSWNRPRVDDGDGRGGG